MKMEAVTIQTSRLEESVEFYKEHVGLRVQNDMRGKGPNNIVFMGNAAGDTCIELIENLESQYEGKGISVGFFIDDVENAYEEAKKKGLAPSSIVSPEPVVKFFYVMDPNGLTLQFISIKEKELIK